MLQDESTKPLKTYIDKMNVAVGEWVALRPIFKECAKETCHKGGVSGSRGGDR